MKFIKGKTYKVKWHDTMSIEAWCDIEQIKNQATKCSENQESIGFYVGRFSDYEVFAATLNHSENMLPYANVVLIPTGVIKKITLCR